jgi:hypothetical protein
MRSIGIHNQLLHSPPAGVGYLKFVPPLCIDLEAALETVDVIRGSFATCIQRYPAPVSQEVATEVR